VMLFYNNVARLRQFLGATAPGSQPKPGIYPPPLR
jgi:hypothetical protein